MPKNWCFLTVVLEKTLESSLDCKRSNQSILKEISSEYSLEGLIWSWSSNTLATWCEELTHWKRPWCWERLKAGGEGDNRDKMVEWHHRLNGHEFEQVPGDGEWQGSLACCSTWSHKVSHTTERLNNSNECYFVNKSFKPEKKVKTFSKTWGQIHNIFQRKFSSDSIWIMVAV